MKALIKRSHFLQVGQAQFRAHFSKIAKQLPGSDQLPMKNSILLI